MTADLDRIDQSLTELTDATEGLRTDLAALGRRQATQTTASVWALIVGAVVALVIAYAVADNHAAIRDNNRLLCPVLGIMASTDPPRTTEAGKQIAAEMDRLRNLPAYGCR